MAFLSAYECDVFISYGHSDDQTPSEHWVRDLKTNVEGKLKQICSREVKVWLDSELMAGDRLNPTIRHALERSAVLVSILTPVFAGQPWCEREAEWFMAAIERDRIKLDAKSRIIPVEKYPIDGATLPRRLQSDTLRQLFYTPQPGGPPLEYSNDRQLDSYPQFVNACASLTHAVNNALQAIRRAHEQLPAQPSQRSIFLAAAGRDVAQYRRAVDVELTDRGFAVSRPELTIEMTEDEARTVIAESARTCDVALHIAGESGLQIGNQPLALAQFVILHQEAVRRPVTRPLHQVVWLPSDDPARIEAVRSTYVTAIGGGSEAASRLDFDVMGGPIAALKEALLDIAAAPAPVEDMSAPVRSLFLICQQRDLQDPDLQAFRNWLMARDWVADMPTYQGDDTLLTSLEKSSILEADATVIFYGSALDSWVKEKRRAIQQAWSRTDAPSGRNRAVYLSLPDDGLKQAQYPRQPKPYLREKDAFPALLILGDCGSFHEEKLRPLLDQLDRPPGSGGR